VNGDTTAGDANGLLDANGDANYTRFRLVALDDAGNVSDTLLGPSELPVLTAGAAADDKTQRVTLENEDTLSAGESKKVAIVFDSTNGAGVDGEKVQCVLHNLATSGKDYIEDSQGNILTSTSITPAANITGNQFSMSNAGLTFEVVNNPTSRPYVSGTPNAALLGLKVKAGSSKDIQLDSVTLQGYIDGNTSGLFGLGTSTDDGSVDLADVVQSVGLYNGNTLVSSIENVNSDGTVVFTDMNLALTKNQSLTLTVRGNIDSSAPYGSLSDRIKFAIVADTDVTAFYGSNGQGGEIDNGSIQIGDAQNGLVTDTGVIMTIVTGGQGTTQENGSPSQSLMTGNSAEVELARFELTSQNETVSGRKFTFGVTDESDGATLSYAKLYTGNNCQTPVNALGGGVASSESPDTNGLLKFTDLDLQIPESSDTLLCVKGATKSVKSQGLPDSGDTTGLFMADAPEIIGGAGRNVMATYIGTDSTETLTQDIDANDTTFSFSDLGSLNQGDVIIIGQEQMMVRSLPGGGLEVVRGVGFSQAVGHTTGDVIYDSTLTRNTGEKLAAVAENATDSCLNLGPSAPAAAGIEVGDVLVALQELSTDGVEYMLVLQNDANDIPNTAVCLAADDLEVVRGMYGSAVQDWTDFNGTHDVFLAEYTERGPVNPLRASKPVFRGTPNSAGHTGESWNAVVGGTGTGTQAILRFAVDASGETGVDFNNTDGTASFVTGDDLIQIHLTGNVDNSGTAHLSSCSLENVTPGNNETLDTIDVSATSIDASGIDLDFDFSTNNLQISQGGTAILEVRCVMALEKTNLVTETVSAQIERVVSTGLTALGETDTPTSVVIYDDGVDAAVDEDGSLIDYLQILGPAFSG